MESLIYIIHRIIFAILVIIICLSPILLAMLLLWLGIGDRSIRMRELARKYDLSYIGRDKPFSWKDWFLPDYKENIIEGKINDRDILICDHITTIFDDMLLVRSKRITTLTIDGAESKISSVKKIDNVLSELK